MFRDRALTDTTKYEIIEMYFILIIYLIDIINILTRYMYIYVCKYIQRTVYKKIIHSYYSFHF